MVMNMKHKWIHLFHIYFARENEYEENEWAFEMKFSTDEESAVPS